MTVVLEASQLSFSYQGTSPIVDGFSQRFKGGELVALTGPSGRGKSTLLYVLGLMLQPTSGDLLVGEESVAQAGDRVRSALRASYYGFVFQDAALDVTRTVLDNVLETTLYRGQRRADARARALELLDHFGVSVRAAHKPGEISGGQAQRIAVCRALLGMPRILLADEPTGNLDAQSSSVVVDALRAHADSGAVVIIATHDYDVMDACDRRVEL